MHPAMFGHYRLDRLLGRGGMGEVYQAYDTKRQRAVALKVLRADLVQDDGFRARFRREADSAAGLQDPHVVPIHDFGEIDGQLFIDMRLIDGLGLDQLIASGPLNPQRAVAIIAQVAEALTDAHSRGVVHRDVKPSNVIVTRSDFAYLADFGIARALGNDVTALTQSGQTVGTLAYMAPERFEGGPVDGRSDIYSLAGTLAECLTGRRPFDATSLPSLMRAHLVAEPPRPSRERGDIPPALDDVIACGMAKDPAARYPVADDLAAAARHALQQWGEPPRTMVAQSSPVVARRRVLPLVAAALAIGVVAGLGGYALGYAAARDRVPTATAAAPSAPASVTPTTVATSSQSAAPVRAPVEGDRPSRYVYAVESNYPVYLIYIDENGDQVTKQSVNAPWRLEVPTASWGGNARPLLSAGSSSAKGDTTVSCSITDDQGREIVAKSAAAAFASAICVPSM
ncbi:MAG: serine/threonine protein kinase [Pseudonocardia sp.]|nr:serine/threonine protein kinase [Pseudonocardia sp.]